MKPELISFKTCPFVRRAIITLLKKKIDFELSYVDLANKPDWFLNISPSGKVPLLRLGEEVLFESAVINEYLDEVYPPALHPLDPLQKAKNRAWIEFTSGLFTDIFVVATTENKQSFNDRYQGIKEKIQRLEKIVVGPFFNGQSFSLVDAAMAPAVDQLDLLEQRYKLDFFGRAPKFERWKESLLADHEVRESVVAEFEDLYYASLDKYEKSYVSSLKKEARV